MHSRTPTSRAVCVPRRNISKPRHVRKRAHVTTRPARRIQTSSRQNSIQNSPILPHSVITAPTQHCFQLKSSSRFPVFTIPGRFMARRKKSEIEAEQLAVAEASAFLSGTTDAEHAADVLSFVESQPLQPVGTKTKKTKTAASKQSPSHATSSIPINMIVTDPDVVEFLNEATENLDSAQKQTSQQELVQTALKIGVMALKNAQTKIDVSTVHNEVERMLSLLQFNLRNHNKDVALNITTKLHEYFDPKTGRLEERLNRLLAEDGELTNLVRRQILDTSTNISQTLNPLIGPQSRLMSSLDPENKNGVINMIQWTVGEVCNDATTKILSEFSFDNRKSSLSRLVDQIRQLQAETDQNNALFIEKVTKELSLDNPKSALHRMITTIEKSYKENATSLSLDVENSSMNRLRREIVDLMQLQNSKITSMEQLLLRELNIQKTRQDTIDNIAARTPLHGHDFETKLFHLVSALVTGVEPTENPVEPLNQGGKSAKSSSRLTQGRSAAILPVSSRSSTDTIVEHCGNHTGTIRSCKVGDLVITMGPDHIAAGGRIVIEAKDDQSYTFEKARSEIAVGRKNRSADVGIFVFNPASAPANMQNMKRYGNDVFVLWDPNDPVSNIYLDAAISIASALLVRKHQFVQQDNDNFKQLDISIQQMMANLHDLEKELTALDDIKKFAETINSSAEKIIARVKNSGTRAVNLVNRLNTSIKDARKTSQLIHEANTHSTTGNANTTELE